MEKSWLDAIVRVLREEGVPMSYVEITDMIIAKGYYHHSAREPKQSVANALSNNTNRGDKLFEYIPEDGINGKGKYKLVDAAVVPEIDGIEISDKYNCATVNFVNRVKIVYNNKVAPSFEKICDRKYAFILKDIPIHFGERHRYLENNYVNDDAKEYLGLYSRTFDDNKREIILFEDAITYEAVYDNEYLDNLIWKVIVHEYAHAIMDTMCNGNKLKQQDPKLYKYREESLANAFALKVLEKSLGTIITQSGFDKIKEFVNKQDEEYKHGLDLYQRDDLLKMMEFWRGVKIIGNQGG